MERKLKKLINRGKYYARTIKEYRELEEYATDRGYITEPAKHSPYNMHQMNLKPQA